MAVSDERYEKLRKIFDPLFPDGGPLPPWGFEFMIGPVGNYAPVQDYSDYCRARDEREPGWLDRLLARYQEEAAS